MTIRKIITNKRKWSLKNEKKKYNIGKLAKKMVRQIIEEEEEEKKSS